MVQGQGQVFLKGGEAGTFPINFFSRSIFFISRNYFANYPSQNCVMHLKKKFFFSVAIISCKKFILSCLKMNLKISHELREPIDKGI